MSEIDDLESTMFYVPDQISKMMRRRCKRPKMSPEEKRQKINIDDLESTMFYVPDQISKMMRRRCKRPKMSPEEKRQKINAYAREYMRHRYRTDPEFREREKARNKEKYRKRKEAANA